MRRLLLFPIIFLLLMTFSSVPPQSLGASKHMVGGIQEKSLQLSLAIAQDISGAPSSPRFSVALNNSGKSDLVLKVGIMLANGQRQYPTAIEFSLSDAAGRSRRLKLRGPSSIAGRVDPLIVPLPAGASFTIPVDLKQYWCPDTKEFEITLSPGTYSLQAHYTGRSVTRQETNLDVPGLALMPYWNGSIDSNRLQFESLGAN